MQGSLLQNGHQLESSGNRLLSQSHYVDSALILHHSGGSPPFSFQIRTKKIVNLLVVNLEKRSFDCELGILLSLMYLLEEGADDSGEDA